MAAIDVTTSATLLATGSGGMPSPTDVRVSNDSGNPVYLGMLPSVTTGTGVLLADGGTFAIELTAGETLYAIAGSTSEVRVEEWT